MYRKFLIIFAAALAMSGCFHDEKYDTKFYLQNVEQLYSGADETPLEGVILYAFNGKLTSWGAKSYDDALNGVAYDLQSGEQLSIVAQSSVDTNDQSSVMVRLQKEYVMLLAVDTVNRLFATRNYVVGLNLPATYVSMKWRPWKEESYSEYGWNYDHSSALILNGDDSSTEE